MTCRNAGRRVARRGGFSLIELMVVVAIAGILAVVGYPLYRKQVLKSHRTAAKSALLDLASREESYFSTNNQYATLSQLGYASLSNGALQVPSASETYYDVTVKVTTTPAAFTGTATPVGTQAADSCGSFTLNSAGVQAATGSNCW